MKSRVSVSEFLMKSRSRLEILTRSRSRRLRSRLHHWQTLQKFFRWFAWDFWVLLVQSLIFCHLLRCHKVHFIFTKYLNTYIIYVKSCREAKLKVCVKIEMTRNPELYTGLNLQPEPEITSPNLTFMFKARFRPESQIYQVNQYVRNCWTSVA